jgi:HEAT repeat protein
LQALQYLNSYNFSFNPFVERFSIMKHENGLPLFLTLALAAVLSFGAVAQQATPVEADLIAVLQDSGADWNAKQDACRGLRQVGTEKSIAALVPLLFDDTLSHMARYALEPMPYPEAGQALRDALAKADELPKVGIITSLGVRRDAEAVVLLEPLLHGADQQIAVAATAALGRIATKESAQMLMDAAKGASKALRPVVAEALLTAAQRFVNEDRQKKQALAIYASLLDASWPRHIQTGAFKGQMAAAPKAAPKRLLAALAGDTPLFRDMAAQIIAETEGAAQTKQYAAALSDLPEGGQCALLRGLASRGDTLARPAVRAALSEGSQPVQVAAVKTLGDLGDADDVKTLVALLSDSDADLAAAARISLDSMQADQIDRTIAASVASAAPAVQVQLLEILASRRAPESVYTAVDALDVADESVRIAALRVIAQLGDKMQGQRVIAAVKSATTSKERAAAERCLGVLASEAGEEGLPFVLDAMEGASLEARLSLLRMLSRINTDASLESLLVATSDSETAIKEEALRELESWPSMAAAPHLLALAKGEVAGPKALGLRGYVRLARSEGNGGKKAGMLKTAMKLVQSKEDKWLVLGAWGTLPTRDSLNALLPFLDDAEVQNEAASAIISVAAKFEKRSAEHKAVALAALEAVSAKCENAGIRERAQQIKAKLAK